MVWKEEGTARNLSLKEQLNSHAPDSDLMLITVDKVFRMKLRVSTAYTTDNLPASLRCGTCGCISLSRQAILGGTGVVQVSEL